MYSRQSVLCPGWLSPNCNPATCRIFDPLNTCVPKIYLDDPLRKACTLKTVNAVFKMVTTSEIKSWIQQAKYILKVLSSCIYKSLCSVCAHMTHNRYPTLSETLTGLALQLKPYASLIHVSADWWAPERDRVNAGTTKVFQHGECNQTRKLLWMRLREIHKENKEQEVGCNFVQLSLSIHKTEQRNPLWQVAGYSCYEWKEKIPESIATQENIFLLIKTGISHHWFNENIGCPP